MAGVFIHIAGNALPRLQLLQDKSKQFYNVLDEIGAYLDSDTVERFTEEKSPEGGTWEQSQAAKDRGGLTLTLDRNLAGSVTHNVNGNTLEHGLGEKYAAIHHFGGKAGRNHSVTLPSRKLIGISVIQATAINEIVEDWLI